MGSALATPATAAGNTVRLWGTRLDEKIVESLRGGLPHPRTGVRLPSSTALFSSDELPRAVDGATVIVMAVNSEGLLPVGMQLAKAMGGGENVTIGCATKGFVRTEPEGEIQVVATALEALLTRIVGDLAVVGIGGPCKANEVASGHPTLATVASRCQRSRTRLISALRSDSYELEGTDDIVGLEVAAALKNVFAIALGYCEGIGEGEPVPFHDLRAMVFTEAVREMVYFGRCLGGRDDTVWGLSGIGDLEVTGFSGRNRIFGLRLARGGDAVRVAEELEEEGLTVEGRPAAEFASELISCVHGVGWEKAFPLLALIRRAMDGGLFDTRGLRVACGFR